MINRLVNFFPLWAIVFSGLAMLNPNEFSALKQFIVPLLALVMFSMGMTLIWRDFKAVLEKPLIIAIAVCIQFLLMPFFAYGIVLNHCVNRV